MRQPYFLTDGVRIYATKKMSKSEANIANEEAYQATDGNIFWISKKEIKDNERRMEYV